MTTEVRIIPLGGLGEIGRNMTAIEYGDDMIVVDCGGMFPDPEHLGVDLIIPDYSWVVENKGRLRGILITHGHEDHIGALPYFLREVDAPVYATMLTRGLIEVKLKEEGDLGHVQLETIAPRKPFKVGGFKIEAFHVNHSIPDAVGFAIETPVGVLVHTGDFKIDYTPVDGQPTDFAKLAELGDRGVLVLMSDSTGAENPGPTPSEATVTETFKRLFAETKGRIIVSTFGSHISRVQQVIDAAAANGRLVMPAGRSMIENIDMALDLGYLRDPQGVLRGLAFQPQIEPERTVIVATGSQGEPSSAVARMAQGRHREVDIESGDTVIFSSYPIPGNEQAVYGIINKLFEKGANVIYGHQAQAHVSGHGASDDQRMMLNLVRPKFFVPVHGEARHLVLHGRHAESMGTPRENIVIARNGAIISVTQDHIGIAEKMAYTDVFVDGHTVGDVGPAVMRDRTILSREGFVVAVLQVDSSTGALISEPQLVSRGFVYMGEADDLMRQASRRVTEALSRNGKANHRVEVTKDVLGRFFAEETGRRPMILPLIVEGEA
ncbi:MAG: ribonuclease J [Anaerolineae bacterium]|nr:ribonuclease J [Anaerolineae bacterium]